MGLGVLRCTHRFGRRNQQFARHATHTSASGAKDSAFSNEDAPGMCQRCAVRRHSGCTDADDVDIDIQGFHR